jgi:hypothetical protein
LLDTQKIEGSSPSRRTKIMKMLRKFGKWLKVMLAALECKHPWLDHSRLMKMGERFGRFCPHCETFIEE